MGSTDGKTGQFELSSPNDARIFCASSENEMKNWIKHIKSASNYKKKSASVSSLSKKRHSSSKNSNTASAKTKKKKATATPKSSKKKKTKKQKSKKVTNASMDKHIERMKQSKTNHSESEKKEKNKKSKTKKRNSSISIKRQTSVPNIATNDRSRAATASQMLSDPSQSLPHRRSVSSMFGFGKKENSQINIQNSITTPTQLTDDEDSETSNTRSQSARYSNHKHFNSSNDSVYSVTFETKPFGLTLNPFDESSQIGAVVMVNHNVNDQVISKNSRFVAVNNNQCKNFQFERIKNICRNATLPTCIKFIRPINNFKLSPTNNQKAVSKPSKQNKPKPKPKKDKSPRNSP